MKAESVAGGQREQLKRGKEKWKRRKGDQEWKERGRKDGQRDRPESAVKALCTSHCICQPWQQQAQPHKGSSGSGSARCTAPTSHAGHETATESAAEIVVFVRLKTRPRRSALFAGRPTTSCRSIGASRQSTSSASLRHRLRRSGSRALIWSRCEHLRSRHRGLQ